MPRSATLKGPVARVAVVGPAVAGLNIAGSAWANSSEPSAGQLSQNVSKSAVVLGMPVSTATWALLGLIVIASAMLTTSRSRHQVLAGLRTQTQDEQVPMPSSSAERASCEASPGVAHVEAHIDTGRTMPAVS